MAVPKRRQSKTRTNTRRSTKKVGRVSVHECPQCHEPKLPHRVCPNCGTYRGRQVITIEAKEKKAE
ncbi:MAG: 50S ribosomal protein L32 [Firmicutes bacterium]|nr:50S ribosomal protein L32 [Bacillota bacterium]